MSCCMWKKQKNLIITCYCLLSVFWCRSALNQSDTHPRTGGSHLIFLSLQRIANQYAYQASYVSRSKASETDHISHPSSYIFHRCYFNSISMKFPVCYADNLYSCDIFSATFKYLDTCEWDNEPEKWTGVIYILFWFNGSWASSHLNVMMNIPSQQICNFSHYCF